MSHQSTDPKPLHSLLLLSSVFSVAVATGQPIVPTNSYPDIYTFFNPAAASNPPGSDIMSKGIIALERQDDPSPVKGTAFLIHTFRDDSKICMCMSGKQLLEILYGDDGRAFPLPGRIELNTNLYMGYLGKDTLINTRYENKTTGYSRNFLRDATLLKYFPGPPADANDAALLLVDRNQLPSNLFATLGYEFTDVVSPNSNQYTISHPHNYPQRLSVNLQLIPPDAFQSPEADRYSVNLPYAFGTGSGGAPLITQPPLPTTDPGLVTAILTDAHAGYTQLLYSSYLDEGPPRREFEGSTTFNMYRDIHASKMKLLEPAIRQNCWRKRDSLAIATNKTYRTTEVINNSSATNPYKQDASVASSTALTTASTSLFSETTGTLEITRLHAQNCTIGGFMLPATYPGASKPWQVTIAAKQIDITPNSSALFSYTPTDSSVLELSTVVLNSETASSTARQLNNQPIEPDEGTAAFSSFKAYPNPSADAIFYINLPDNEAYSIVVSTIDGKEIYRSHCDGNPFQFQLRGQARGHYVLQVYATKKNEPVYQQLIVY